MDNLNYYNAEDKWNELTPVTIKSENTNETTSETSVAKSDSYKSGKKISSPVLTIQLIVCLLLLIILYTFKTFSSELFLDIKNWYNSEVNATLYFSGDFSQLDYSSIFSSTNDEI